MIDQFNEKGHPMVFREETVNTGHLIEKCRAAIASLTHQHGMAERLAEACFMIALSELENNWKQQAEAAEAEVQRLNATAQPKCQKCGDTAMADSGGTQPWGEQILNECDCATAQPVSDGWVSLLTDRQRSVINFALYRFMNDAYSNASIVAQDKRLDSSMVDTFTADARDAESLMSEITSYRDNLAAAPGGQDD